MDRYSCPTRSGNGSLYAREISGSESIALESIRDFQIVEEPLRRWSYGLVVEGKADAACVGMGIGNKLQRDFQPTSAVIAHVFHDHRLDSCHLNPQGLA